MTRHLDALKGLAGSRRLTGRTGFPVKLRAVSLLTAGEVPPLDNTLEPLAFAGPGNVEVLGFLKKLKTKGVTDFAFFLEIAEFDHDTLGSHTLGNCPRTGFVNAFSLPATEPTTTAL
jgi:hypothetical protein